MPVPEAKGAGGERLVMSVDPSRLLLSGLHGEAGGPPLACVCHLETAGSSGRSWLVGRPYERGGAPEVRIALGDALALHARRHAISDDEIVELRLLLPDATVTIRPCQERSDLHAWHHTLLQQHRASDAIDAVAALPPPPAPALTAGWLSRRVPIHGRAIAWRPTFCRLLEGGVLQLFEPAPTPPLFQGARADGASLEIGLLRGAAQGDGRASALSCCMPNGRGAGGTVFHVLSTRQRLEVFDAHDERTLEVWLAVASRHVVARRASRARTASEPLLAKQRPSHSA
jgi:hypothetical protein